MTWMNWFLYNSNLSLGSQRLPPPCPVSHSSYTWTTLRRSRKTIMSTFAANIKKLFKNSKSHSDLQLRPDLDNMAHFQDAPILCKMKTVHKLQMYSVRLTRSSTLCLPWLEPSHYELLSAVLHRGIQGVLNRDMVLVYILVFPLIVPSHPKIWRILPLGNILWMANVPVVA